MIYVILKLKLIKGKCLLFVNSIDRCYRLKLFLEQFAIRSCVLNSELPLNSRYHIVEEFNRGVYDYIIATDEAPVLMSGKKAKGKKKQRRQADKEYGVSRGVDFKNVQVVLNFDFPDNIRAYRHRIGRTARGHASGKALSFVTPQELERYHGMAKEQETRGTPILPFTFDLQQIEGFRYRCQDAYRAVTRHAIREARLREIKAEMLHSQKLARHFEENPTDLLALRHDKQLQSAAKLQAHLRRVPTYLLPKQATATTSATHALATTLTTQQRKQAHAEDKKRKRNGHYISKPWSHAQKYKKRKQDPLKTFK